MLLEGVRVTPILLSYLPRVLNMTQPGSEVMHRSRHPKQASSHEVLTESGTSICGDEKQNLPLAEAKSAIAWSLSSGSLGRTAAPWLL